MKSLKRLITMILAVSMVLTSVGIVALADSSFSDITDSKVATAVDKLVAYGIITGYDDNGDGVAESFKPDNQITRAEFAAIVTRMKGVADNLPSDSVTGFWDLDSDSSRAWARPYVKAAVDLKIINGFEDGSFRAAEPVTYEQAVKMLICAIGYDVIAQSEYNKAIAINPNATWSAGYISAAVKHGITNNAYTTQVTEPANRGVVAVLTSNSVDAPTLEQDENGNLTKPSDDGNSEQNFEEVKGIVSGTYYTGIDSVDVGLSKKEIMIGTGSDKRTYELSESLVDEIDIEDLIGKYVVAYYDKLEQKITSVTPRNNTATVIKEQDIININGDDISYYTSNGKKSSVSIAGYTKIYNGKYYPQADLQTSFKNGQIELIEGGGQKVAKITSYEVFVVQSKTFNSSEERVHFKYGKTYKGNTYYEFPNATVSRPELYVNGVKKEISSSLFNEWAVINLLESPNVGGNGVNKMYLTTGAKTGKITEGADIDDRRKLTMDNKNIYLTYDYSINPERVQEFELGSTYTYYLDYTGQIAAVNKKAAVASTKYDYGYVIVAEDEYVGLILKNGTYNTVTMKDRVKVDGVNVDKNKVKEKLGISAGLLGNTGHYQPVKYSITGSGDSATLTALDTVATVDKQNSTVVLATAIGTNSDDAFVYNTTSNSVKAKTTQVAIDGILYNLSDSKTTVIYVPDDKNSEDAYSVMGPSTAFAQEELRKIEVFGADPDERTKTATLVLMYGTDPAYSFIAKTPYMVVTRVISDGEKIEGYTEDSPTTPKAITVSEEKFKTPTANHISASAVEKGDIIRYITSGNEIIAIEMVYDASSAGGKLGKNGTDMAFDVTTGSGELHVKYAEAFDMPDGENKLSVTQNMGSGYTDAEKQSTDKFFQYKIDSSTVVYRVSDGVVLGDKSLENISINQTSPSEVIVFTRSTTTTNRVADAIYIVK